MPAIIISAACLRSRLAAQLAAGRPTAAQTASALCRPLIAMGAGPLYRIANDAAAPVAAGARLPNNKRLVNTLSMSRQRGTRRARDTIINSETAVLIRPFYGSSGGASCWAPPLQTTRSDKPLLLCGDGDGNSCRRASSTWKRSRNVQIDLGQIFELSLRFNANRM